MSESIGGDIPSFDIIGFQEKMDEARHLHINGDYVGALAVRLNTLNAMLDIDEGQTEVDAILSLPSIAAQINVAGNYRNIAATYERLNDEAGARKAIAVAMDANAGILENGLDLDQGLSSLVWREKAANEFYVGAFDLKNAIGEELSGVETAMGATALSMMHLSQDSFDEADRIEFPDGRTGAPHQYHLNALRRYSLAESLYGDRRRGAQLALQALKWSITSESKTQNDSTVDRAKAVTKVAATSIGSLSVSALAGRVATRPLALRLTKKLL